MRTPSTLSLGEQVLDAVEGDHGEVEVRHRVGGAPWAATRRFAALDRCCDPLCGPGLVVGDEADEASGVRCENGDSLPLLTAQALLSANS